MEIKEVSGVLTKEIEKAKKRLDEIERKLAFEGNVTDFNKNHFLSRLRLNFNKEGEEKEQIDDERIAKGGVIIVDQEPATYHSITRKNCEYKVVNREIRIQVEINTSRLNFRPASIIEFTASGSIKAEIEAALKVQATVELLTAWQTITGAAIPTGVRAGGSVEASIAAKMAAQIILSVNIRIIRYVYVIDGVLLARLVANIRDLWNWVGDDCEELGITPDPIEQEYQVKDPVFRELPISPLRFVIWEITSPSITPLGRFWAENERNKMFRDKLQQSWDSGALRTLPLPQFMPEPL